MLCVAVKKYINTQREISLFNFVYFEYNFKLKVTLDTLKLGFNEDLGTNQI